MAWRGSIVTNAASRERIARAAYPLLALRVGEGLVAWFLCTEALLVETPSGWAVPAAFLAYVAGNLAVALRYGKGDFSPTLLAGDLLANVATLAVPIAASGAWSSPLLLLFPLKAAHYAIVFGGGVSAVFLAATAAMLVAVDVAGEAGLLTVVPLAVFDHPALVGAFEATVAALLAGGVPATLWLRRVCADASAKTRALSASERADAGSAFVANALLSVAEAVSKSTSLDGILEAVVEIAPRNLEVDYCGIALWEADTGCYTGAVGASVGPTIERRLAGLHLTPEEVPDFEWVRRLGRCAVVNASESAHAAALEVPGVLIAPLLSRDQFFGVMEFARRASRRPFTQRDLIIADGVARLAAVALERAQLTEHGRRLIRAVESTEEAVLITDARRRVTFVNEAFLRTFGYRAEEVLGHDALEIGGAPRDFTRDLQEQMLRRSWRGEALVQRKDGTAIPIMLTASLIRDDDGRLQGAVAILQDISAEKMFQEQMQRADRLAAVGETAAGMAHEVNNALAAIFGQLESSATASDAELRAALTRIDGQARRIAGIVQGVLGFARPRPPRQQAVDLAAVAAKTVDLLRHDLEQLGIRLETDFRPGLPAAEADPQQVQQVLLNLCRNAIQAMRDTPDPWLRVDVLGNDDRLAIRVSDVGPGIAPDLIDRIFDPFFSTKSEGSGLGLSVSYAIARAHGGDLQVASEAGRGSTFTLLLPMAKRAAEATVEKVLLVDDDPEVAEALAEMLAREGLQVSRAASGGEALAFIESGSWDAIFLDVRLPDLSGPEVYHRLEASHPDVARRVVFVTGGLWRSESRLRHQLPLAPILAKPCTQDQVREVLRQLRNQRQAA
jgi:PAS domain S-box-containing protein